MPRSELITGLVKATGVALSSLDIQARPSDPSMIARLACTAAQDHDIGQMIASATQRAGADGVITLSGELGTNQLKLIAQTGMRLDRGYISPFFVSDPTANRCRLVDCRILVTDVRISNMLDLLPILEEVARAGEPLAVIAGEVEGEALATLIVNNERETLRSVAVRAPGGSETQRELLADIAAYTGANPVISNLGGALKGLILKDLGKAGEVLVEAESTHLVDGCGDAKGVEARIQRLRASILDATNAFRREKLQERLANLVGKIIHVSIDGSTTIDLNERLYRAESALHSTRTALEFGWVVGGGRALLNARMAVGQLTAKDRPEALGIGAVSEALERPIRVLCQNANKDPSSILRELGDSPNRFFDANRGTIESVGDLTPIDSVDSLRVALRSASSYARAILQTDAWALDEIKPSDIESF